MGTFVADNVRSEAAVAALTDGAVLGNYEFLKYKATSDGGFEEASIHLGEEFSRDEAALKKVSADQATLDDVVVWTRDIANLPADTASPERLAAEATALGKEFGLKVTVFDEKKLLELGCGGILAVGSGSAGRSAPDDRPRVSGRGPSRSHRGGGRQGDQRSTPAASRSNRGSTCRT